MSNNVRESEFQGWLQEQLYNQLIDQPVVSGDDDWDVNDISVKTYEEAGILSRNSGLVIRLQDGSEWQLTLVRTMW